MKLLFALLLGLSIASVAQGQELRPFVRGSQQAIVAAHQGKPFILAFWSLSCTYCATELAMYGKLLEKYPALDLVLVSTDAPTDKAEIAATLDKFALGRAESWVFADSHTERLRFEIDREWYGELPRGYFFDAQGEVKAASGELEQAEVERWIVRQYDRR